MPSVRFGGVILAFAIMFLPMTASAQVDSKEKKQFWPEGRALQLFLFDKLAELNRQLASQHAELVKVLASATSSDGEVLADGNLVDALREQQVAWLKYRSAECNLVGAMMGGANAWPQMNAQQCEIDLSESRLQRVKSSLRCIQKIPAENLSIKQDTCLQQLAPLTKER